MLVPQAPRTHKIAAGTAFSRFPTTRTNGSRSHTAAFGLQDLSPPQLGPSRPHIAMTQGQRLYAEKPYLRLQVPHSLDEPPTSHVPLATSSPRSCASMSGHRGPARWHVDRTSLELIFVVSIPDQARGTDRTAYGDVSLMSSPASRSICRQYTGPILVNIPAHHQVQLRPNFFFADSNISQNTTPSADTKQALSTGCYTIHLFQPWYPYLTMSGCMVGYRLWQTQSSGMVPINTIDPCPTFVPNFTALAIYSWASAETACHRSHPFAYPPSRGTMPAKQQECEGRQKWFGWTWNPKASTDKLAHCLDTRVLLRTNETLSLQE